MKENNIPNEVLLIVNRISEDLQKLEELIKKYKIEKVNIRFPRGVIRKANDFRQRLSFIKSYNLRTNIAYTLIFTDVLRWILNRFDIEFTGKEMIIKYGISVIGNIMESILKHITGDKKAGIHMCCSKLVKKQVLSDELKKEILEVWGKRCKQHLIYLEEKEFQKYQIKDYNQAILVFQKLEEQLKKIKNL